MSGSALLIGVDGGGTSCEARIVDAAGTFIGQSRAGPANIATDDTLAYDNILKACKGALHQADLSETLMSSCSAVLGLAGANVGEYARGLKQRLPFQNTIICSDGEIAMHGALGANDGTVAIIGTGSVYFHRHDNITYTAGGWGSFLNDHAGGAWLGRQLLEQTLLAMDKIISHTMLTRQVSASFEHRQEKLVCGPDLDNVHQRVHQSYQHSVATHSAMQRWSPDALAAYAITITDAANNDDPIAASLMQSGAAHIESALTAFDDHCHLHGPLCLQGSLGPHYRPWLSKAIQERLCDPHNDALHGAVQMAIAAFGKG